MEFSDYKDVIDYIKTKTNDFQSTHGSISTMDISKSSIKCLAFPMEVEKTWSYGSAVGNITKTVMLQENVTVPAGTFNTYKIQYDYSEADESSQGIIYYEWFANDVGIIKEYMETEIEEIDGEGQPTGNMISIYDTLELSSYNTQ